MKLKIEKKKLTTEIRFFQVKLSSGSIQNKLFKDGFATGFVGEVELCNYFQFLNRFDCSTFEKNGIQLQNITEF
jgi:hypothetical protein